MEHGEQKNQDKSFFSKLKESLAKTRKSFVKNIDGMIFGEKVISQDIFEDLEEILITADVGPAFTYNLIDGIKEHIKRSELYSPDIVKQVIKDHMIEILQGSEPHTEKPLPEKTHSIMVIGVNGTGKTTTIGKLAYLYKQKGKTVMLAAADTFRAAAIEQLEIWSQRVEVPIIKQKMGSDPSAVVFDAVHAAQARESDILIVDTAGRLHTKVNLMEELKKVKRIMARELSGAPHETLLVVDATTGQNALSQAKLFNEGIGISGLILTKLDGTAKGGIVIRIAQEMQVPIRYIGIGEGIEDLREFDGKEFVNALFG